MNYKTILKLADQFYSLATSEELPEPSKNLSTILKNLEQLETYTAKKEYAEKNLKHLSSGSSRIVYLSPNKTIIKMAKNDKGIAQNKVEANPKMKSKLINKIISKADDDSWIETHYLDKMSKPEFEKMVGINFDDFGDAISYGLKKVSGNTDVKKPKNFDKIKELEIYKELERLGKEFDLLPGDLERMSSWGIKDNHPVIIDAGLSKNVYSDHYDDSSSS
jgi:hypothetical protein